MTSLNASNSPQTSQQVGTVVEGAAEFYSSRMTKKERKQTIVDEIMGDDTSRPYLKKKYREVQMKRQSGGKNYYKKLHQKRQQY
jgi:hypothetical protein